MNTTGTLYTLIGISMITFAVRRYYTTVRSVFQPAIIYTTVDNNENAKTLARMLIQARLAACVQLKEVNSIYEWKNQIEEDEEIQLTIKFNYQDYERVEKFIKKNHPYDVPQIIAVEAVAGSAEYLDFMREQTKR